MKVKHLIGRLRLHDPEAEVFLLAAEDGYYDPLYVEKQTLIVRRPRARQRGFGDMIALETKPRSKAKRTNAVVLY